MMASLRSRLRRLTSAETGDAGFTLVELLTAMAIFGILMALMSSAMLSGMKGVSHLALRSEEQATDRQVSETVSRLLRYAVNPEMSFYVTMPGVVSASSTSITFYSSSGYAGANDRPNKVHIWFDPAKKLVYMTVMPAMLNPDVDSSTVTADSWTWATPTLADRRVLMRSSTNVSPLNFSVRVRCYQNTCPSRAPGGDITTGVESAVTPDANEYVESVVLTVGDPAYPDTRLVQQVRLPNLWKTVN